MFDVGIWGYEQTLVKFIIKSWHRYIFHFIFVFDQHFSRATFRYITGITALLIYYYFSVACGI